MQYIVTFVWSFLLVSMLNYVVGSIMGVPFDLTTSVILSVVMSILVFVATAIIPNGPTPETEADHH